MIYIVFIAQDVIGHIFTELSALLEYIKKNEKHTRIEVWSGNRKVAVHSE